MKRWNGWGNVDTDYPVPLPALDYMTVCLGSLHPTPDSTRETLLSTVPKSRLPAHPLVETSAEMRLTHSRGQSLPDWIALRYGWVATLPGGVAFLGPRGMSGLLDYLVVFCIMILWQI